MCRSYVPKEGDQIHLLGLATGSFRRLSGRKMPSALGEFLKNEFSDRLFAVGSLVVLVFTPVDARSI